MIHDRCRVPLDQYAELIYLQVFRIAGITPVLRSNPNNRF